MQAGKRSLLLALAAMIVAVITTPAVADLIVDDFSLNAVHQVQLNGPAPPVISGSNTQIGINPNNTIGGSRRLDLRLLQSASVLFESKLVVAPNVGNGILALANDPGNRSQAMVTWNANGTGLGGVDLTSGGTDTHFLVSVVLGDLSLSPKVEVWDTNNNLASYQINGIPAIPSDNVFPFEDFVNFGNTDFTSIDKIKLTVDGVTNLDMWIDLIGTTNPQVPEPMSLAVWSVGLAAAGLAARRRNRARS